MTDPRKSNSLAPSRTKMKLDAWTDWFIVGCATVLTALDKFPPEWTAGIFVGVAGLAGLSRKLGKGGGTAAGLLFVLTNKLLLAIGLSAILFGCAGISPVVKTIGKAVLTEAAGLALDELAKEKGVTIDKNGAVCFESPGLDVNLPQFDNIEFEAISCVAAHVE